VAARGAPIGVVLADAELDSEANHQHIRQRLGAKSIIPARRRGVPNGAIRNQMFRAFPKKPYRQRSKIESVFSAVKRKLSSRAPGRSLTTQIRQALLLGLAYNMYRLRHRFTHRGCQQSRTLMERNVSVDSKELAATLSPLDATLTRNRGGGHGNWPPRSHNASGFISNQLRGPS
jgi:Transposase DDE domain